MFKQLLGEILDVDPATITDAIVGTGYGPVVTFTHGEVNYLDYLLFGGEGTTWANSGDSARAYILDEGW